MRKVLLVAVLVLMASIGYCQEQPLQLTIKSDKEKYEVGEVIIIDAIFKNNSNKSILIVTPQDGSDSKLRYPYCIFEVKDSHNKIVEDKGRCLTTDPLTLKSFYEIQPGRTFKLYRDGYRLDRSKDISADSYVITFSYSTDAEKESQWFGRYSDEYWINRNNNEFWKKREAEIEEINKMLKKVPALNLTSNSITIEVAEKKDISKQEALKIAERVCREEGWEWKDVWIEEKENKWLIRTNSQTLGGNANIEIDKSNGKVIRKFFNRM